MLRKKHVRYIYPTMHLPVCLFVTCMSLYSILLPLFPFSVRQFSTCKFHTFTLCLFFWLLIFFVLCLHVFFFFYLFIFYSLSIPQFLFLLSGQKLLRLFSSKVYCLCLTACVCCILALWAPSTSLLFCLFYSRYASLFLCFPSLSTCILTVLLLSY